MRVAAIQSSYIPWRGYFDFISNVDVFVFYDDVQYTPQNWRNRNKLKTPSGTEWITVPVKQMCLEQLVSETLIDSDSPWARKHLAKLQGNYGKAKYFSDAQAVLEGLGNKAFRTISELNIHLIKQICAYLSIETPITLASNLALTGSRSHRLVDMMKKLQGTVYVSGSSAEAYLDKELFFQNGLRLEYKSYSYEAYPQLWGEFIGEVSIVDLIANCGPNAKSYLHSKTPNSVVCS
jgi:hypothetical protein